MTHKERYGIDFRPDGMRGACPECNESFETEGSLRSGMIKHYEEKHKGKELKAVAYMNRIEREIYPEIQGYFAYPDSPEDECRGKIGGGPHSNGSSIMDNPLKVLEHAAKAGWIGDLRIVDEQGKPTQIYKKEDKK
jgi:hypothetical protein